MRGYARSRAVHKRIGLSHTGVGSMKRGQSVTTNKHEVGAIIGKLPVITMDFPKSSAVSIPGALNALPENISELPHNSEFTPEVT